MPIYGIWSDSQERWFFRNDGTLWSTADRVEAMAQLHCLEYIIRMQIENVRRENAARIAQYNAEQGRRLGQQGIVIPTLRTKSGGDMPGIPIAGPVRGDGPSMLPVPQSPGWRVAEIGRKGLPKDMTQQATRARPQDATDGADASAADG